MRRHGFIVVTKERWIKLWLEVAKHGSKEEIAEFVRMYTTRIPH